MTKRVAGLGLLVVFLFLSGCGPQIVGERPVASVVYTPARGEAPLEVTFDGSLSAVPGGTIAAYAWDFGDGHTGTGREVSHRYRAEGTYLARLTVTSEQGLTGTTQVRVIVGESYPLDVVEWTVKDAYFGQRVVGRVKNIGTRKIAQGRVVVRFYDTHWNIIQERSDEVNDLAPGAEEIFEITTALRREGIGKAPNHTIYTEVLHSNHPLSP